eukprot:3818067-Prymnesium_polylepis.1
MECPWCGPPSFGHPRVDVTPAQRVESLAYRGRPRALTHRSASPRVTLVQRRASQHLELAQQLMKHGAGKYPSDILRLMSSIFKNTSGPTVTKSSTATISINLGDRSQSQRPK